MRVNNLELKLEREGWYSMIFRIVNNPDNLSFTEIAKILNKKYYNEESNYHVKLSDDAIQIMDTW